MLTGGRRQTFTPMCHGDQLPGKLSPCWSLPSFGLTNPFVIPRSSAATVSPFTTLRMVNSAASVCITKGRSRSRTWSWQQDYLMVVCTRSENTLQVMCSQGTEKWTHHSCLSQQVYKDKHHLDVSLEKHIWRYINSIKHHSAFNHRITWS